MKSVTGLRGSAALVMLCGLLQACAPQRPIGITDLAERPGEAALLAGLRAYDDAQYGDAETLFNRALRDGMASPRDRASAHKHLAFIYCTSARAALCEAAFRDARGADPGFKLGAAEAGHPLWGPVYRRVIAP
jgi:hypothetical protein